MHLETDIEVLRAYTPDQWDALLDSTLFAPHPRRLVIVEDRRSYIVRRLSEGARAIMIARELGISGSLVSRILSGQRK